MKKSTFLYFFNFRKCRVDVPSWKYRIRTRTRAVDPHSVFADPDSAVVLNADPDPASFFMHCKKSPYEEFSGVEKTQKIAQK